MTNLDLITSAFRRIGMLDENEAPSAEQGAVGLQRLNQLLAEWQERGIGFPSWHAQTVLSATLPLPDWAERAVGGALCIELADEYDRPVSDALAAVATNSFDALQRKRLCQAIQPVDPNLPMEEAGYSAYDITQG